MASRRVHARRHETASAQVLLGWVSVRGCERAKENAEEGVREKRQELTDAQQLQKEHEDALETSGDDQVKALEDAISRGNDEIKECRDSTKEAMKALATACSFPCMRWPVSTRTPMTYAPPSARWGRPHRCFQCACPCFL